MKKIEDKLVKKIYKSNLTQDELLFLLHIAKICNNKGITNIHYLEISKNIYCSVPNFYKIIKTLSDKGFISIKKCSSCGREITIKMINNDFNIKNKYKNYLDLNSKIFDMEILKDLRAGSIRVLLYLIFRINKQKSRVNSLNINKLTYKNINSICNELNITKRMLTQYIAELIKFKILIVHNKNDKNNKSFKIFEINKDLLEAPIFNVTEKNVVITKKENSVHRFYINVIKNLCRRNKIKYNLLNLNDTATLLNQYYSLAKEKNKDILNLMATAFKSIKNELNSIVLHKILKTLINNNLKNKVIIYN